MNHDKIYCLYCGRVVTEWERTTEHLVPKSKGGNESYYNKKACCSKCNGWRGNKSLEYWKAEVLSLLSEGRTKPPYTKYDLEIIAENIPYWDHYINTADDKLLKNKSWKKKALT